MICTIFLIKVLFFNYAFFNFSYVIVLQLCGFAGFLYCMVWYKYNHNAAVFVIFVFHKNKNKTNKSHLQCTDVLYINYVHAMKVR